MRARRCARSGLCPRVRERRRVVRDPEAVRLELVVREPDRQNLEPCRGERRLGLVFRHVERPVEHVREAESRAELLEIGAPTAVDPELGFLVVVTLPVEAPPDPRHEIAPVVEVEVRDRDRLEERPLLALAQPAEDAGSAVEEQPLSVRGNEVAGVCASCVRPGRGRPDDGETHVPILTAWRGRFEW